MKYKTMLPWLMVVGAAMCLRLGIASLAPVLSNIQSELAIAGGTLGLLTAIPVICMGALSTLGHILNKKLGLKRAMVFAFIILTVGLALRLQAHEYILLLFTAALVGISDAIIRPLLSGFIKVTFPQKTHAAMGLYATSMGVGGAISAYATPPLTHAFGSWQAGLAFWAIPAAISGILWALWSGRKQDASSEKTKPAKRLDKLEVVWLTLFFGLQSGTNYVIVAWLPSLYITSGITQHASSALIAFFFVLQTATALFFPMVLRIMRVGLSGAMVIFTALAIVGTLTLWWLPMTAWSAAILMGIATGGLFPIALLLPLELSSSGSEATRLSGVTQTGGYLISGVMPWLAGVITDHFGTINGVASFTLIGVVVLCIVTMQVVISYRRAKHH